MRLDAAHSPHCQAAFSSMCLNTARQAPSSASTRPATTIDQCFLANTGVLASVITHKREMEEGEKMGGRPTSAYDISIPSCMLCYEKKKKKAQLKRFSVSEKEGLI